MARKRKELLNMGALAARKVKQQIASGEKLNCYKAMREVGYSESSARSTLAKNTDAWKEEMKDMVKELEVERAKCLEEMKDQKLRNKASYRDRLETVKVSTNLIQLLSGRQTSNDQVTFTWSGEDE